jgi:homoserine dehydrogenase
MTTRGRRRALRLAIVGFGSVGRRFAELLRGRYGRELRAAGVEPRVTAVATARHGRAVDPDGLPIARLLRRVRAGERIDPLHRGRPLTSTLELIARAPADVVLELTPLDPAKGQPATAHVRRALERGCHVVTANKGPVAFALGRLRGLARRRGRRFLFEGAVMDGTPVFNLASRCLPGARVLGFRGLLNSTTTRVLSRMEEGVPLAAALREAQEAGVAEADPRYDLDGWDAAVKGCAIANSLMGASIRPVNVDRQGIGTLSPGAAGAARARGERLRLVVRGRREGRRVRVSVRPESLPLDDLLVSPGADGVLVLETDLMGEVGIWEGAGGVDQTAYALLSDLLTIVS